MDPEEMDRRRVRVFRLGCRAGGWVNPLIVNKRALGRPQDLADASKLERRDLADVEDLESGD